MHVTALMDVNAHDEHHQPENWRACPACRVDCRVDYDECWQCGEPMGEADR